MSGTRAGGIAAANDNDAQWAELQDVPALLLRAASPADVAAIMMAQDLWLEAHNACVIWSTHWPRNVETFPPEPGATARMRSSAIAPGSRCRLRRGCCATTATPRSRC